METVYRTVEVDGHLHRITVTQPDDPAYALLQDGYTTTPTVFDASCYICVDSEFARMGLPLCYACPDCGAHVAADDGQCEECHPFEDGP
jgi:hypothetical protein